jgi:CMP-N-acetylneuraminic acid synthetase
VVFIRSNLRINDIVLELAQVDPLLKPKIQLSDAIQGTVNEQDSQLINFTRCATRYLRKDKPGNSHGYGPGTSKAICND